MSDIFKGDRVFRKVNYLKEGLWGRLCREESLEPTGVYIVVSVHYFNNNTYLKIRGVRGLYLADCYRKVINETS